MPILIVVIIAVGAGIFLFSRSKKDTGGNWIQFVSKGKEAGFTLKEVDMLRHLASQSNLEDPCLIYSSQSQLDICIRSMVRSIRISGGGDEQGTQDFLSKLYDYRKKLEMEKPGVKNGIINSRQIDEGQVLRILVPGTGVFRSQVVKNISQYMTISRPVNNKNSTSYEWDGAQISVYFWRENDAGYVFDTKVIDEVYSLGISSLKIAHCDQLFRTQKRKSVRIKVHKAAFLYLPREGDPPHRLEINPGLKCFLEDLSDTGCAVTVGGKAEAGLRVKLQFALDNTAVCMSGTVRSVVLQEETNRSLLRIEADPLPLETRNHILGEVFGMLPEDDDDELPFRVLDDEAAGMVAQAVPSNSERFFDGGGAVSAESATGALTDDAFDEGL